MTGHVFMGKLRFLVHEHIVHEHIHVHSLLSRRQCLPASLIGNLLAQRYPRVFRYWQTQLQNHQGLHIRR